jgi:hypothetical protein
MSDLLRDVVERMLGCDWGYTISHPADTMPCREQATRLIAVHDPRGVAGGVTRSFKLCGVHALFVIDGTDPHGGCP